MAQSWLNIIGSECWSCHGTIKVAVIEPKDDPEPHVLGPDEFTPTELDLARKAGVLIEAHHSKTLGERYLANTCPHCGCFSGRFYLFAHHYAPAHYDVLPFRRIQADLYCPHCLTEAVIEREEGEIERSLGMPGAITGYCIGCRKTMPYDLGGLASCPRCMRSGALDGRRKKGVRYCHKCGREAETTRQVPLCQTCEEAETA